jgi:hypothetical protein
MMRRPVRVIAAGGRKNHDSLRCCFGALLCIQGKGIGIPIEKALQAFVE